MSNTWPDKPLLFSSIFDLENAFCPNTLALILAIVLPSWRFLFFSKSYFYYVQALFCTIVVLLLPLPFFNVSCGLYRKEKRPSLVSQFDMSDIQHLINKHNKETIKLYTSVLLKLSIIGTFFQILFKITLFFT